MRHRWNYLQTGISKIMLNLQDGVDLQTVSTSVLAENEIANLLCSQYMGIYTFVAPAFSNPVSRTDRN